MTSKKEAVAQGVTKYIRWSGVAQLIFDLGQNKLSTLVLEDYAQVKVVVLLI